MRKLKIFLMVFSSVVTCVVLGSATYISILAPQEKLSPYILWQILFVSALCSVWTMFYSDRELSKKGMLIANLIHYILVNIVVLSCGLWFKWFCIDNLLQIICMLLLIAVIYLLVCITIRKRETQVANQMNERLRVYQEEIKS